MVEKKGAGHSLAGLAASRPHTEDSNQYHDFVGTTPCCLSQHEGQSRDVADALDLQQCLRLGVLGLTELLDLTIVMLDLGGHLCDLLENRSKRLCRPGGLTARLR
jgi:hypothetical protein